MLLFAMLLRNAASGNQICGGFQLQSFSFRLPQCPEGGWKPNRVSSSRNWRRPVASHNSQNVASQKLRQALSPTALPLFCCCCFFFIYFFSYSPTSFAARSLSRQGSVGRRNVLMSPVFICEGVFGPEILGHIHMPSSPEPVRAGRREPEWTQQKAACTYPRRRTRQLRQRSPKGPKRFLSM